MGKWARRAGVSVARAHTQGSGLCARQRTRAGFPILRPARPPKHYAKIYRPLSAQPFAPSTLRTDKLQPHQPAKVAKMADVDTPVTLRTRKFIRNPLLGRKQMVV